MINKYSEERLAKIIKETRKNMTPNTTQEIMADKLYLSSRQAYANIENGKSEIRLYHIFKLCEIFNCDIGYLFGEYPTKKRVSADVQEVTGLSEKSIETLLSTKQIFDTAKLEYDKADKSDDKLSAECKFLVSGIKLYTLNFLLENEEKYGILDLIGRYLFGIPFFNNEIDETAELYMASTDEVHQNIKLTEYLQKSPINYLYHFDADNGTTFPIYDFISADDIYASLLVQLNNKLSEMSDSFRENNKEKIEKSLDKYLKESRKNEINQILD